MSKPPSVYFPVESLVGLGHFNRAGRIVRGMAGAGMDVTVASGTFVDPARFFAGAQIETMPAYVLESATGQAYTLGADGKRSIVSDFNRAAWQGERIAAHARNLDRIRPDVMFTEFWPFDRPALDGEMEAMLDAPKRSGLDPLRLVSLRDVMDTADPSQLTPERAAQAEQRAQKVVALINTRFDAVLVHGDPRFVELKDTFARTGEIDKPIHYTGYVVDDMPQRQKPDAARGELLVSCGSGVDGDEMIFAFLTAWEKLIARAKTDPAAAFVTDRPVRIVCGPRFSGQSYDDVNVWVRNIDLLLGKKVTVERYREDFTDLLARAAFSVSLAGYNTTLETLAMGTPALLIPKYAIPGGKLRVSTEQLFRLERLQDQKLARFAHPNEVQNSNIFADKLLREITGQLAGGGAAHQLDFNGAGNTLAITQKLLAAKKRSL